MRVLGGRPARRARRIGALVVGVVLAGGVLAGCGGSSGATATASSPVDPDLGKVTTDADGVQEVTLQTEDDYVFNPDHFTVAPGKVRLTVTNVAKQLTHDFRFTPGKAPGAISAEIPLLAPGDSRTIEFT